MSREPAVVHAPKDGVWRIARGDNPLAIPTEPDGTPFSGGNRFDALDMNYGVLYFGSDLETCFGEVLARFRPSMAMMALVEEEWRNSGFMAVGTVGTDWRQRRTAVHVRFPSGLNFLDLESPATHQFLRQELATGLASLGVGDLDVSTVRGRDRRVTQMISQWAYMASDSDEPLYAGIRYESRIQSGWECWALFDDDEVELEVVETHPITADMEDLQSVAKLFGLTIF